MVRVAEDDAGESPASTLLPRQMARKPRFGSSFVDLPFIRTGIGRLLFSDLVKTARERGLRALRIDRDPGAAAFYERMGAERAGDAPSGPIPGRFLPSYRLRVPPIASPARGPIDGSDSKTPIVGEVNGGARAVACVPMSVFGDFLKLRREELNLEQADLARELEVQQQTVSKWERARAVPKPERIRRLAEVLRVDVADLMKYAGYLADGDSEEAQAEEPFHLLLGQVGRLSNDQLIVLIDQAWEEYRVRLGFSLEHPHRGPGKPARL